MASFASTRATFAAMGLMGALSLGLTSCSKDATTSSNPTGINKINHVVVIYMENHSFDNLYGEYPGVEGLSNATNAQKTQIDTATGLPFATLPPPTSDPNHLFTTPLPNKPFAIDDYAVENVKTPDLVHKYYQEQTQIDGGQMDKFAAISDAKGLSMGFYHTAQLPMYSLVSQYTLCDHFFHSAFGGSFLNHIYFISAAVPVFPGAPASITAQLDGTGKLIKDGQVTPDGYVVNTSQSVNAPHRASAAANLVPNQTMPTIGDRLSEKNISWAWYSGGWNDMLAGHGDTSLFQFHHQPFVYFQNYADGTQAKKDHLKDETDFMAALSSNTVPSVSFVKFFGANNEHPGYAALAQGEQHLVDVINAIKSSKIWDDCAIIITYDENGGFWDHVAPPVGDKWGPGSRVPGIIISPFAKKGFIDHTNYETLSILSFIEKRWGLTPLTPSKDGAADPFSNAFSF